MYAIRSYYAHELNNAIGVVTRTSSYLTEYMGRWLAKVHPEGERLFRQGLEGSPLRSTADLRAQARRITSYNVCYTKLLRPRTE